MRSTPPASPPVHNWPVAAAALHEARAFLRACAGEPVAVACDSDVDGLAAAVLVERTLEALGARPRVVPARRGEHIHHASMQARVRTAARLVVLDMGSRPAPIMPGLPTLIVDHHDASLGVPPGAVVVNGYDAPPVAPAAVLAYSVCAPLAPLDGSEWLAVLGAIADLGSAADFAPLVGAPGAKSAFTAAASLLNAARRAPHPMPEVALELLRRADSARDVTSGRFAETHTLERMRDEVRAELDRCGRVAPRVGGGAALIRFSSAAQVHPLVAVRWARRLRPLVVIAANDGYLPGRTNFAVRCDTGVNLVAWLRQLPFEPGPEGEYANGHPRATGGSLTPGDFARFLRAAGLAHALDAPAEGGGDRAPA